jgi:hypothetical protein
MLLIVLFRSAGTRQVVQIRSEQTLNVVDQIISCFFIFVRDRFSVRRTYPGLREMSLVRVYFLAYELANLITF